MTYHQRCPSSCTSGAAELFTRDSMSMEGEDEGAAAPYRSQVERDASSIVGMVPTIGSLEFRDAIGDAQLRSACVVLVPSDCTGPSRDRALQSVSCTA